MKSLKIHNYAPTRHTVTGSMPLEQVHAEMQRDDDDTQPGGVP